MIAYSLHHFGIPLPWLSLLIGHPNWAKLLIHIWKPKRQLVQRERLGGPAVADHKPLGGQDGGVLLGAARQEFVFD